MRSPINTPNGNAMNFALPFCFWKRLFPWFVGELGEKANR